MHFTVGYREKYDLVHRLNKYDMGLSLSKIKSNSKESNSDSSDSKESNSALVELAKRPKGVVSIGGSFLVSSAIAANYLLQP